MYEVDDRDSVEPLVGVPQSSIGAPLPLVLADEHRLVLAYYVEERDPSWDGTSVRVLGLQDSDEPIAIVRFELCIAHTLGPPNDEAFAGHPLADRGLEPYGTFEIRDSSWIRLLERRNSVHPYHRPDSFRDLRHLIFTFHDTTFECVCRGGFCVEHSRGALASVVPRMLSRLAAD